ncbi:MAG: hypothetical protein HQK96_18935 [Nitrospirae bacterium]|nr:hypothetical protein [Nitrospirota bacterium]
MDFKTCTGKYGCGRSKSMDEFCLKKAKNGKYYPNSYCNECNSKASAKYQKDHVKEKSEYNKEYVKKNKEKHKSQSKAWYIKNKEITKKRSFDRYNTHKKQIFEHWKKRYHFDPQYRLALNLRRRIGSAIRGNWKCGSAIKNLGCSVEDLKTIIESMFYKCTISGKEMTWDNYGTNWHIDHIIPLSSFDLTDTEQFCKACHYTNMQPLWLRHNLSKGDKIMTKDEIEQLKTT